MRAGLPCGLDHTAGSCSGLCGHERRMEGGGGEIHQLGKQFVPSFVGQCLQTLCFFADFLVGFDGFLYGVCICSSVSL